VEPLAGYLSLHQNAAGMSLKWTPNQLMNGGAADDEDASIDRRSVAAAAADIVLTAQNSKNRLTAPPSLAAPPAILSSRDRSIADYSQLAIFSIFSRIYDLYTKLRSQNCRF